MPKLRILWILVLCLFAVSSGAKPYGDGRAIVENDDIDAQLPSQYAALTHSWGYTDPKPTNANFNVQWSAINLGGTITITNIEGLTAGGSNVVDLITAFRTNGTTLYTTAFTGMIFTTTYTNFAFSRSIATGSRFGMLVTNVNAATNFTVSVGYRE